MNFSIRRKTHTKSNTVNATPIATTASVPAGHYDVRKGAASYAPIVGTLGAFTVTATIFLFANHTVKANLAVVLAAGLLVVAMLSSILAAFTLGAIGAETTETPNLPPAIMFTGIGIVVAIVNIFGAFEALSTAYFHEISTLFVIITDVAGGLGIYFIGLVVFDSVFVESEDSNKPFAYRKTPWIRDKQYAEKASLVVSAIGMAPVVAGLFARWLCPHPRLTGLADNLVVAAGLVIALSGIVASSRRATHPIDGKYTSIGRYETLGSTLALGFYVLLIVLYLPR